LGEAYCPVTTKRSVLSAKGVKLGMLCSAHTAEHLADRSWIRFGN
jgi:hypothetical protein